MINKSILILALLGGLFALMIGTAAAQPATNGLILWLDASDTSSIQTNVSGSVLAWTNKAPGFTNALGFSGSDDNQTSAAYNSAGPTYAAGWGGAPVINFVGNGYLDNLNFSAATPGSLTIFLLAAANTNGGDYSAFLAARQSSAANDYQTGLNFDQGLNGSRVMNLLNVEGSKAGGGGGFNFDKNASPFGKFHVFEIDYGGGTASNNSSVTLTLDGVPQGTVAGSATAANLNQLFIGTRAYVSGNVQNANHDLQGTIGAVLMYDHQVTPIEQAQTTGYLLTYFTTNLAITPFGSSSVALSWANKNYTLQSNTNLATATWTDYAGPIVTNNNKASAIIAPPLPAQFFRLKQ